MSHEFAAIRTIRLNIFSRKNSTHEIYVQSLTSSCMEFKSMANLKDSPRIHGLFTFMEYSNKIVHKWSTFSFSSRYSNICSNGESCAFSTNEFEWTLNLLNQLVYFTKITYPLEMFCILIGSFIENVEGLIRIFAKNSVTYIHCDFLKCHVWTLTYIVTQTNSFMNESKEKI